MNKNAKSPGAVYIHTHLVLTNEKTLVAFLYPKMTRKSKVTRR